jgi:fibronectin-binding autotransporter adhesin
VTIAGAISGSGNLVQLGTGTVVLTGTNTYSGGTTINSGTLQLGDGSTNGSITGDATDNGTLAFDPNGSVTIGAVISGTGNLVKLGSGTVILTGVNTYTGGTMISAGTLQLGDGATNGSITGDVTDNGTLAFDPNGSVAIAAVISGTGNLVKLGSGTVILTGTNTYAGGTTISAGTLQLGDGVTNGSITGDVTDNGTLAFDPNGSVTFGAAISGTGNLVKLGTGAVILTGTNIYSGGTTISAGTLQLGNGVTDGIITDNVTDNGTLTFDLTAPFTFGGAISGTGGVTQIGVGTVILTGNNTYAGTTNVASGVLRAGSPTAFSAGSAFIVNFILDLNGFDNAIGSLAGTGTVFNTKANSLATLTVGGNDASTTFFGAINDQAGTLALVKVGMGTLTLAGTSTYSGGTTIENGAVVAASNSALGMGPVTVSEPSNALEINAGATLTNIVTLINGGILNNSGTLNEGASNLTVANGGTITNSAGGVITASQIQSTGAEVSLFNSGTIHGNIAFANFANTVQLFAGSSIVGNLDLGTEPGANLILDGSGPALLSQAVTGTLTDGGSLVKQGTGTWTLDRDVNVPGLTNITAGTLVLAGQLTSPLVNVGMGAVLQVGNGGGTGSLLGNVVDNGSVLFDRTGTLAFDGIISGAGGVTQGDSGTTVLSAINTYSGGTVVNAGTLVVNSVQALGVGDVVVNGGILTTDPQPINVLGNYTQNAGGTLQLQVAGANPGQYDTLHVTGNATLGGTLQLISSVFQPKAGEQLTLVTTGGAVAGRFAQFLDPYTPGTGFNTINLIYGRNSVLLQFLNMTGPISPVIPTIPPSTPTTVIATINFASFALTPNELAAANLVDRVELNPKAANLIAFLFQEPVGNLPGAFEKMSPEGLTAFDEITFSNANIQRLNLEGRLDDIRNGSNGFSSNMKVNGATVNLEDRADADGKSSKAVVEPVLQPGPENRWGVWVTGFGDFVNVDGDGNAQGYNFTTGGVSLGLDYRITDQLAIGVMGEYSHTWTDLKPAGHIDVDSGRGGVYATWFSHGIYINGAIYGGHNNYDSGRASLGGLANGGTEGAEWSTFVGGGYDFHIAQLVVGPIASLQYTEVGIDSFGEKGSLAPLDIHSGSAESLRSDVGFRAFYQWQIGKIVAEPSLKAAWEHEYKYSALPITAGFAGIPGPSATFFGPSEGHDSAVVSAGVSVQVTPAITTYVNYDGQLGRGNYDSNAVTGGVRISF